MSIPRRIGRWLPSLIAVIVAAAIAGYPVYVHPYTDKIEHADAIFILGGNGEERYKYGIALAQDGWAPNLVVSNPGKTFWIDAWCHQGYLGGLVEVPPDPLRFTKWCPVPDPATTQGEAQALRQIASEHSWTKVIVVTHASHVSRTRYLFERCFKGDLMVVASPTPMSLMSWTREYLEQTLGYLKAIFYTDC